MRGFSGLAAVGGLVLALGATAHAQDSLGSFGSYPAGITTGSSYGFFPGGYRQAYMGVPTTSGYYMAPRTTYYSSGFYGGVPGSATYGSGVNYSAPGARYYGAAPVYPSPRYGTYYAPAARTYYAPSAGTYYAPAAGSYRPGLFGGRSYRW